MQRGTVRIGISGWAYPPWRGEFYPKGLPQKRELDGVRAAALEVFNILFDAPDIDTLLDAYVAARTPPPPDRTRPARTPWR